MQDDQDDWFINCSAARLVRSYEIVVLTMLSVSLHSEMSIKALAPRLCCQHFGCGCHPATGNTVTRVTYLFKTLLFFLKIDP